MINVTDRIEEFKIYLLTSDYIVVDGIRWDAIVPFYEKLLKETITDVTKNSDKSWNVITNNSNKIYNIEMFILKKHFPKDHK